MDETLQRDRLISLGKMIGSNRLRLFEALVQHARTGLTVPDMTRVANVPSSSIHRYVAAWVEADIVYASDRRGKATVFRPNADNFVVVEAARALNSFVFRVASAQSEAASRVALENRRPTAAAR